MPTLTRIALILTATVAAVAVFAVRAWIRLDHASDLR